VSKRLARLPIYLGALLLVLWATAPIYWVLVSSISNRIELYAVPYKHWIPQQPTLQNYLELFTTGPKYRAGGSLPSTDLLSSGLRNSIVLGLSSAALVTLLSATAGYAFARLQFRLKQGLFVALLLLVPLPVWVSLVSLYFLVSRLGLLDNLLGMVLIFVAYGAPLYIWLMQTYVDSTPREIEEAALIDGCSRLQALFRVVLPIARPGLTSVFLVAFLSAWNGFLIPFIFSSTQRSQPMTVVLSLFIGQYEVAWESMSAAAMLTMLPPALLAFFFQRYLVRGLTMGAVQ